jgi:hypothetical protein
LAGNIDHGNLAGLSTGADHSYIDQDVTSGSSPTFDGTNFTGIPNGAMDETYINADGTVSLSANWDIGDGYRIEADEIRARDGDGLKLYDDGGNGVFVEDGGRAGIRTTNPGDLLDINTDGSVAGLTITDGASDVATLGDGSSVDHNGILQLYDNSDNEAVRIFVASGQDSWINAGNVGIGNTNPDTILHAADETATTDAILDIARIEAQCSGTVTDGFGAGLEFELETNGGQDVAGILAATWEDATHATRQSQLEFWTNYQGDEVLSGVIVAPSTASVTGNTRGAGAVDLQGYRSAATEVASGNYSVVAGGYENTANASYATVGGGIGNLASGVDAVVAGGLSNTASGLNAIVGGGYSNEASAEYVAVFGGKSNSASNDYTVICGGDSNTASGYIATVGGGKSNIASYTYATVGGGYDNEANETSTVIAGGQSNTASGSSATVGGGSSNTASADYATVVGGTINEASAKRATVLGGTSNTASGEFAIAGGYNNTASGKYSVAIGRRADSNSYEGAFVWADSENADFTADRADQFKIRCDGGLFADYNDSWTVEFYDDGTDVLSISNGSVTAHLTDDGAWTDDSLRAHKENFRPVWNDVLDKISELPVELWNMRDSNALRCGPCSDEFYDIFGLGYDDGIKAGDVAGVALAAIQMLYDRVQVLEGQVAQLVGHKKF